MAKLVRKIMTKHWKCNWCGRTKETTDDIVIAVCPGCLEAMREDKGDELVGLLQGYLGIFVMALIGIINQVNGMVAFA
jgi:hypothetical protein